MKPTEPTKPSPFAAELAALPPEVAAELEDHLMESLAEGMRSGMTEEEARHAALRSLGIPVEVGRACEQAVAAGLAASSGWGWGLKAVAAGWLGLATLFATRPCQASEPTHASLGGIAVLTLGCVAAALALRRWGMRVAWPLTAWSWGMGAAAGMALTSTGLPAGFAGGIAMSPVLLMIVALFGVASGILLLVQCLRPQRTAALRTS